MVLPGLGCLTAEQGGLEYDLSGISLREETPTNGNCADVSSEDRMDVREGDLH